jgi:hypothetical protein
MNKVERLEVLKRKVELEKKSAEKELKRFQDDFVKNSTFALEWADSTVEASQLKDLCIFLDKWITKGEKDNLSAEVLYDAVKEYLLMDAINYGSWGEKSTSAMSNLSKRAYLKVRADFFKQVFI